MHKFLILLLLLPTISFALVDYSEQVGVSAPVISKPSSPAVKKSVRSVRKSSPRSTSKPSGHFNMSGAVRSLKVKGEEIFGRMMFYETEGHFQTPYNLYLDFEYWYGQSSSPALVTKYGTQKGNPKMMLGFNFLRMGGGEDLSAIDFYLGAMMSEKNSELASSRTDKLVGAELSKRFHQFVLGLGYEMRLTGTPGNSEEMAIGNIQTFKAALGMMVSHDIRFLVEGANYKIGESSEEERENRMKKNSSFSVISPQVQLGLGAFIELTLGASFLSKKPVSTDDLIHAKLWDIKGAFGNSVFSSLNISL